MPRPAAVDRAIWSRGAVLRRCCRDRLFRRYANAEIVPYPGIRDAGPKPRRGAEAAPPLSGRDLGRARRHRLERAIPTPSYAVSRKWTSARSAVIPRLRSYAARARAFRSTRAAWRYLGRIPFLRGRGGPGTNPRLREFFALPASDPEDRDRPSRRYHLVSLPPQSGRSRPRRARRCRRPGPELPGNRGPSASSSGARVARFFHHVLFIFTRRGRELASDLDRLVEKTSGALEAWQRGRPVIRSWTPGCVSFAQRTGCTTGRGW